MQDKAAETPKAPSRDIRLIMGVAACVTVSLGLHAGVIALALMRLAEDAGVAERSPSIVSVAQKMSESLDAVAQSESATEAGGETQSAEPVAPEEIRTEKQELGELAEQHTPDLAKAVRLEPVPDPAEAVKQDQAENVLPAQAALPEPPIESITAAEPSPEASERPQDTPRPEKARKPKPRNEPRKPKAADIEKKSDPRKQAERDAKKKRDARKREAALEKPNKSRPDENGKQGRSGRNQGRAGRASASAGAMANFAAQVRAAVARRKPGGRGAAGTAVVSFSLTSGGSLAGARLARSSGNSALDSLALGAVRGAAFPRPPAGATRGQLSFSIPFYFR